jgi:hypothetical protein
MHRQSTAKNLYPAENKARESCGEIARCYDNIDRFRTSLLYDEVPMSKVAARSVARRGTPPTANKRSVRDDIVREGIERSAIHLNVGQNMFVITEDKMRLQLNNLVASERRCQKWHVPTGMLLTELPTLAGPSFHGAVGLSGDQWDLLFRVLFVLTFVWLLKTLASARRSISVDGFIDSLKDHSLEAPARLARHPRI